MPINDYGFLFLILNSLKPCVGDVLKFQELMTESLTLVINKGGLKYLDGRILQLLGAMKVTNIDFWLFIEKKYTEKLASEDTFKVIEGLTGLAIANRGSTEFLSNLQL